MVTSEIRLNPFYGRKYKRVHHNKTSIFGYQYEWNCEVQHIVISVTLILLGYFMALTHFLPISETEVCNRRQKI